MSGRCACAIFMTPRSFFCLIFAVCLLSLLSSDPSDLRLFFCPARELVFAIIFGAKFNPLGWVSFAVLSTVKKR